MKCEEFEAMGLDAHHDGTLSVLERAAAREHANSCSRCAALQDSWQAAGAELRLLLDETQAAQTPPRVEMRLRQEYRTRYRTFKAQRAAAIAAWALAAAAVVVGAVGWNNWRNPSRDSSANNPLAASAGSSHAKQQTASQNTSATADPADSPAVETLVAENYSDDFTLLPGSELSETEDAPIVRVRMQRGALSAWGLQVNEERADEWIQVELLLGNDGQPQAVRLPSLESQSQ